MSLLAQIDQMIAATEARLTKLRETRVVIADLDGLNTAVQETAPRRRGPRRPPRQVAAPRAGRRASAADLDGRVFAELRTLTKPIALRDLIPRLSGAKDWQVRAAVRRLLIAKQIVKSGATSRLRVGTPTVMAQAAATDQEDD